MCRNIKRLRRDDPPVTKAEIEEAALNLVRKLSGFRAPSDKNRVAFATAVQEITNHAAELLQNLPAKKRKKCAET